jgi:hypothetical protein
MVPVDEIEVTFGSEFNVTDIPFEVIGQLFW